MFECLHSEKGKALIYLEGFSYKRVETGPVSPRTDRHRAQVEVLLLLTVLQTPERERVHNHSAVHLKLFT